jgi:hypothetical protein
MRRPGRCPELLMGKNLNTAGRLPFVLLGIASLIAGAWGGLVRLPMNLPLPGGNASDS